MLYRQLYLVNKGGKIVYVFGGWRFSDYTNTCCLSMMVGANNSEDGYFFILTGV